MCFCNLFFLSKGFLFFGWFFLASFRFSWFLLAFSLFSPRSWFTIVMNSEANRAKSLNWLNSVGTSLAHGIFWRGRACRGR